MSSTIRDNLTDLGGTMTLATATLVTTAIFTLVTTAILCSAPSTFQGDVKGPDGKPVGGAVVEFKSGVHLRKMAKKKREDSYKVVQTNSYKVVQTQSCPKQHLS